MADYVHAAFRMEGLPCDSGVYFDRGLCLRFWAMVGDVSVCLAHIGTACLEIPEGGIPLVLECPIGNVRAVFRFALLYSLCDNRSGRRAAAWAVCRVQLVGVGNSVGHRALRGQPGADAGIV